MGGKAALLVQMGITSIPDIPEDFPLSASQRPARECFMRNKPCYYESLAGALSTLDYPRKSPVSGLEHGAILHEDASDPREAFITSLLSVLEHQGTAPILVDSSFEATRLDELARWFPEYGKWLGQVRARLWDLLTVIRNHVYHPGFRGSFSIKHDLPALLPEMSYEDVEVADGNEAGLAYERMKGEGLEDGEPKKVRESLLDYCRQDSLAMVKLLEHLSSVA